MASDDTRPNVLLLTVDSLRADYVHGPNAVPNLETLARLAGEGTYFDTAYSNAAYTKSSFRSIMSGTYPWMFESVGGGYGPNRPHVAELFADAGYATGGFHTNTYLSPTHNYDRGFDYYLGRDDDRTGTAPGPVEVRVRGLLERGLATRGVANLIHTVYRTTGRRLGIQLGSQLYRPAAELNDAVVDWLARTEEPAFTWVHYMDVHNPYYPHEGTVSEGVSRRRAIQLFHEANERGGDTPPEDVATLERLYRGEIQYLDRELGDLFERLAGVMDLENTLVVFASDHGEAFCEHDTVFHVGSELYDENVHVPLLVRGPGIEQGVIDTPVSNVDIVPTLLSAAGIDVPASVVGTDLAAIADGATPDRYVFSEAYDLEEGSVMITDGRYKFIRELPTGATELYDRIADPGERENLVGTARAVEERFESALADHLEHVRTHETERVAVEVTEDVRLQLRRLGYDE